MPEPVTFRTEETPALSSENEEMLKELNTDTPTEPEAKTEEPESLLAGKYKTPEDLEKAYKELESKLGQQSKEEQPKEEATTEDKAETEEEKEKPEYTARELYGDYIGERFEENEIDFNSMTQRWTEEGKLSDDDYKDLEGAGFQREMVDAYLSGLNYQVAKDSQLTEAEISKIKAEYGGESEYNQLIEWAGKNLSQEEVDGFNAIINSQPLPAVKLAIAGIEAKRTATEGREPKLIGGRASTKTGERFDSTAQLVAAMSDPLYSSDPAFRKKVSDKLKRSSIL